MCSCMLIQEPQRAKEHRRGRSPRGENRFTNQIAPCGRHNSLLPRRGCYDALDNTGTHAPVYDLSGLRPSYKNIKIYDYHLELKRNMCTFAQGI